jgi:hypothetical protein
MAAMSTLLAGVCTAEPGAEWRPRGADTRHNRGQLGRNQEDQDETDDSRRRAGETCGRAACRAAQGRDDTVD